jgi:hypothetical protein
MRLILIPLLLPMALVAAAPAPAPQKPVPEATPAGEPVDCIQTSSIRSTLVRSDKVIDFVVAGGKVYRNELPYSCPSLGFEQRFVHKSSANEYCSVDTITVLQSGPMSQGASCGLGKFQPVKLAKGN